MVNYHPLQISFNNAVKEARAFVMFDSAFMLDNHIKLLTRSCFYYIIHTLYHTYISLH